MDFTVEHVIGERIDDDFQPLIFGKGYDHNYIINKDNVDDYVFTGVCRSPKTGIKMEIYTSQPGIQLYTGNWLTGNFAVRTVSVIPNVRLYVSKHNITPTVLTIRNIPQSFCDRMKFSVREQLINF